MAADEGRVDGIVVARGGCYGCPWVQADDDGQYCGRVPAVDVSRSRRPDRCPYGQGPIVVSFSTPE